MPTDVWASLLCGLRVLGILYEGNEGYAPVELQDEGGSEVVEVVASQAV